MTEATWKVDTSSPVLVTGAEGYIAGVLIKQLLDAGATVHGTVRNLSKPEEFKYLTDVTDDSPGSIKLFRPDLTEPGLFAEGMKGCSVVFHIASPVSLMVDDPQKELVDPAVNGTKDVLNMATKTLLVRHVVMTSLVAAIYTDASNTNNAPGNILTEHVINMTASIDCQPYYYDKLLAEMAAWQVAGSQNWWTMATINPAFVTGPGLKYHASSESFKILILMGSREYKDGVPNLGMGYMDVQCWNIIVDGCEGYCTKNIE